MGYRIQELDEKTWLIEEEAEYNVYMYLLAGTQKAVLLDTGYGTIPLDEIVRELTQLPVTVLYTHGHYDHIGGNRYFSHSRMHRADRQLYLQQGGTELDWFEEAFSLDLGERTLEVFPVPGHTRGCCAILDVERRQLFTGDTCCKGAVLLQFDHSADLATYRESIASILEKKDRYDRIWPAHHAHPLDVQIPKQFLEASDILLSQKWEKTAQTQTFLYGDIQIVY